MTGIYIALGANIGNRQANLALSLRMLPPLVRVDAVSALYESAPEGDKAQPSYYNAACRVTTGLSPALLLRHLKRVEREIGRRPYAHGHGLPRPIDLDIVLYEDVVLDTEELTIPHPRLLERPFVLRPLRDIEPDLLEPREGHRLADALAALGEEGLRQLAVGEWWQAPAPV